MKSVKVLILFFSLIASSLYSQTYPTTGIYSHVPNYSRNPGFTTTDYAAYIYVRKRPQFGEDRLPFRLLFPKNYNPNAATQYPLFVMYHGRGEAGTDNNYHLIWGGKMHLDARNGVRANSPQIDGFVLFPQEPFGSWATNPLYNVPGGQATTALAMSWELIDSLIFKHKIDQNRIYAWGLSAGGTGTWASVYNRPDLFAAAQPMSAPGDTSRAKFISNIPLWIHQGGVDTNPIPYYSYIMLEALKAAGAVDSQLKYTEYANTGHNVWTKAYVDPDFFPFFLRASKRKIRVLGVNPFCQGESLKLGFSDNMEVYQWYKDNLPIQDSTRFQLTNINTSGKYFVAYKWKSNSPWVNSDTITVTQSLGAAKPTVVPSGSLLLPSPDANNVRLKGPKGFDLYEWSNGTTRDSLVVSSSGNYTLRVRNLNGCWSLPSDVFAVRTGGNVAGSPAAPSTLDAKPRSATSILLTWEDLANSETGYEIYRSNAAAGPYRFSRLVGANLESAIDTFLAPNTRYFYKIRAVNSFGGNLSSELTYASTYGDFQAPTTPTRLRLHSVDVIGGIRLNWRRSTDNIRIKEYRVMSNGTLLATVGDTTAYIKPPAGVNFMFQVIAVDYSNNQSVPTTPMPFRYNGAGLLITYFDDTYNNLPNFNTLIPDSIGIVSRFDMSSSGNKFRNQSNYLTGVSTDSTNFTNIARLDERYGINIKGYVRIANSGTYRFFLNSDDGSRLWINNGLQIDFDGLHGTASTDLFKDVAFATPGWYPIEVSFFNKTGARGALRVAWEKTTGSGTFSKRTLTNWNVGFPSNSNTFLSYLPTGFVPIAGVATVSNPSNLNVGQNVFRPTNPTAVFNVNGGNGSPAEGQNTPMLFQVIRPVTINEVSIYQPALGTTVRCIYSVEILSNTTGTGPFTCQNCPTANANSKYGPGTQLYISDTIGYRKTNAKTQRVIPLKKGAVTGYTLNPGVYWIRVNSTNTGVTPINNNPGRNYAGLPYPLWNSANTPELSSEGINAILAVQVSGFSDQNSGHIFNLKVTYDKPKIVVNWVQSNINALTGYEIYRAQRSDNSTNRVWVKIADINNPSARSFVDSVGIGTNGYLEPNYWYSYGIRAIGINTLGTQQNTSPLLLSTDAYSLPEVVTPINLLATPISNTSVRLNWTDNNAVESLTEIERSSYAAGPFFVVGRANRNAVAYTDTTGILDNTYYYRLRTLNYKGYSAYSSVVSATTLNIPNTPINLVANALGYSSINLSWTITDDVAFGFSIYRSTLPNSGFVRIDSVINPGLVFYQDRTANANTTYYYRIRAFNAGVSGFSTIASATTTLSPTVSTADWRLPIVPGTFGHNFDLTKYSNARNIAKLKDSLEAKRDLLNYLFIGNALNDSRYIQFQLPNASEFPNGGMITYSVSQSDGVSNPINANDTTFFGQGRADGFFRVRVYVCNTNDFSINDTIRPHTFNLLYALQKIDIPTSWGGKFIRIEITKGQSNGGRPIFLSEVGLYKFLGANVRHNYFILTGASIEVQGRPMGLIRFRKLIRANPDLAGLGKNMVIFNLAEAGTNAQFLRDSLPAYLARHPYASYVATHQGGNNINSSFNNMRKLTYDRLVNNPYATSLIQSFESIINTTYAYGKIPYLSRMHYRDYRVDLTGTCGNTNDAPAASVGRNQENGSLPINLLIDSITARLAPHAYIQSEKRSGANFYPISLNNINILGGDGVHPQASTDAPFDVICNYWINYWIRHVYTGSFSAPLVYNPAATNLSNGVAVTVDCGKTPSNKPDLLNLTAAAVKLAQDTKLANDIWEARILVEQIGDKNIRVPYVLQLDSLRDFRSPANPTDLTSSAIDNTSITLNWLDLSSVESGYQIFRSLNGGAFSLLVTRPANSISYVDAGLNAVNEYSYYVRAINGSFRSGITNITKIRPSVTYYLKPTGDPTLLSSWGRSTDGSGNAPVNFTAAGQTYIIANRSGMTTINSAMNVSGGFSKVIIPSGQSLKIGSAGSLNASLEIEANGKLDIASTSLPTFSVLDSLSSVVFNNSYTLPSGKKWGNVEVGSSSNLTIPTGQTTTILANLQLSNGSDIIGNNSKIALKGNLSVNDTTSIFQSTSLLLNGIDQNLDYKSGTLNIRGLELAASTKVNMLNSSKVSVTGIASTDLVLVNDGAVFNLANGKLFLNGNISLNKGTQGGVIASNGGSIYFNTTSADSSNLYMSEQPQSNILNDLYVGLGASTRKLDVKSPLTINNNLKLTSGIFETNNVVSLVASDEKVSRILKVEASASLRDSIVYENYLGPFKKTGNYYLSTSVKDRTYKEWNSTLKTRLRPTFSDLRYYQEATNRWNYIMNFDTILKPGTGYSVYVRDSFLIGDYKGAIFYNKGIPIVGNGSSNTGNFAIPIFKDSENSKGWNLVGNPYPCELDWNNASGWDKSQIQNMIYYWDGYSRKYMSYDGVTQTSLNGAGSIIPPGQGFFVKKTNVGNGSLFVNENAKIGGTPERTFYRSEKLSKLYINFTDGSTDTDQSALVFGSSFSNEVDDYDHEKNIGQVLNVSSTMGTTDFVLQCREASLSSVIPLNITAKAGKYILTFEDDNLFVRLTSLTLFDAHLGTTTNLMENNRYDFEISSDLKSVGAERFVLNYTFKSEEVTGLEAANYSRVEVYPNPSTNELNLYVEATADEAIQIKFVSASGIPVFERTINVQKGPNKINLEEDIEFKHVSSGVYLLTLSSKSYTQTFKIIRQ